MKRVVLCLALVACGASARHKAIATTFAATDKAAAELVSYSHDREAVIVASSTTEDAAKAQLVVFRKDIDHAEHTLDGVYRAVAAAAIADDDQSVAAMLQVAAILVSELHALGAL